MVIPTARYLEGGTTAYMHKVDSNEVGPDLLQCIPRLLTTHQADGRARQHALERVQGRAFPFFSLQLRRNFNHQEHVLPLHGSLPIKLGAAVDQTVVHPSGPVGLRSGQNASNIAQQICTSIQNQRTSHRFLCEVGLPCLYAISLKLIRT